MGKKRAFLVFGVILVLAILLFLFGERVYSTIFAIISALIAGKILPFDKVVAFFQYIFSIIFPTFIKKWFEGKKEDRNIEFKSTKVNQIGEINISGENITVGDISIGKSGTVHSLGSENPPPLPEYYVKRQYDIDQILKLIFTGSQAEEILQFSIGIVGIGGSGKTLLANAITREPALSKFRADGIVWVAVGQTFNSIENSFSLLGEWLMRLGTDPRELSSLETRVDRVRNLIGGKRLLFVFDDVWDAASVRNLLDVFGGSASAIITTRSRDTSVKLGIAKYFSTRGLVESIAKELVEKRLGRKIDISRWKLEIKPVIQKLAYHPLGISLAAAQVSIGDVTWGEIKTALDKNENIIDFGNSEEKEESLAITFQLSIDRLGEKESQRFIFLGALAKGFPFTVVDAANMLPDLPSSSLDNPDDMSVRELTFEDIKEISVELRKYYRAGLLEAQDPSNEFTLYFMHPLLNDHCVYLLKKKKQYELATFLHALHYFNLSTTEFSEMAIPFGFQVYEPQLLLILERSYSYILENPNINQLLSEYLRSIFLDLVLLLSSVWENLGKSSEAVKWQERAITIAKSGGQEEYQLRLNVKFADSLGNMGRLAEAKKTYENSLVIAVKQNSKDEIASIKNALGVLSLEDHRPEEALTYFLEALKIWNKLNNENSIGMVEGNIGHAYLQLGQFEKAVEKLEQSVKKATSSKNLAAYGKRFGNLGYAYLQEAKFEIKKAIPMMMQSLEIAHTKGDLLSVGKQLIRLAEANYLLGYKKAAIIYGEEAVRFMGVLNYPKLAEVEMKLKELKGELPDPIEPLSVAEMFAYTARACAGDRVMKMKIGQVLEFILNEQGPEDLKGIAAALNKILNGKRDEAEVIKNVDEFNTYNLKLLLLHLTQPSFHEFVLVVTYQLHAALRGDIDAKSDLVKISDNLIAHKNNSNPFDSEKLGKAIKLLVNGERDLDKLSDMVPDDIFKSMFKMLKAGKLGPVIYGEGLQNLN